MFETNEFRERVTRVVARNTSVGYYQNAVVDELIRYAVVNEPVLMNREMAKAAYLRRGVEDAEESVAKIIRTASQFAKSAGSNTLTVADFERAYNMHFCTIWPFCR